MATAVSRARAALWLVEFQLKFSGSSRGGFSPKGSRTGHLGIRVPAGRLASRSGQKISRWLASFGRGFHEQRGWQSPGGVWKKHPLPKNVHPIIVIESNIWEVFRVTASFFRMFLVSFTSLGCRGVCQAKPAAWKNAGGWASARPQQLFIIIYIIYADLYWILLNLAGFWRKKVGHVQVEDHCRVCTSA